MNDDLPLRGRKILIVEDQYLLAKDVSDWLEEAGATVVGPARDAATATRLIDAENVQLAVVDINLGCGATYEVAARLSRNAVPFLFATGYDAAAIPDDFKGTPRLEKPFKGPDLVRAIQALPSGR